MNVAKVEQLIAAGRFTPAHAARFKADKAAWAWFRAKAPWYQRLAIHRVMSAKKEETRIRRFEDLLATGRGRGGARR